MLWPHQLSSVLEPHRLREDRAHPVLCRMRTYRTVAQLAIPEWMLWPEAGEELKLEAQQRSSLSAVSRNHLVL
jgi:hypothetical protein